MITERELTEAALRRVGARKAGQCGEVERLAMRYWARMQAETGAQFSTTHWVYIEGTALAGLLDWEKACGRVREGMQRAEHYRHLRHVASEPPSPYTPRGMERRAWSLGLELGREIIERGLTIC